MSIPRSRELWLVLALVGAVAPLWAGDDQAAQRERIARERAAVMSEAEAAQAACARQFAVTACVDRVKAERRERLQSLNRERALLDEELRKRRAAQRLAQIEQRQAERAGQAPEAAVRTRAAPASAPPLRAARSPDATLAAREAARAQGDVQAAQRAAAAARRASEAQSHSAEVEQRNRDRVKQRKPAAPLPTPQASANR